ncbi:unnamed protein product [Gongylonema pulchrum]|uniref:Uncharacterized protein n=1 Tax=Gongylonema pulchrum TaxID=637853 RepID=A0A183D6D6_9BILA|nr:unnamed protein product [Gongylonema pulchrum]
MRKQRENRQTGAVLDLATEGDYGNSGDDLSWLPDPDRPKKYDAEWNEIGDDTLDDRKEDAGGTDEYAGNIAERQTTARRRKRKHIREEEEKALALLHFS